MIKIGIKYIAILHQKLLKTPTAQTAAKSFSIPLFKGCVWLTPSRWRCRVCVCTPPPSRSTKGSGYVTLSSQTVLAILVDWPGVKKVCSLCGLFPFRPSGKNLATIGIVGGKITDNWAAVKQAHALFVGVILLPKLNNYRNLYFLHEPSGSVSNGMEIIQYWLGWSGGHWIIT